MSTFTCDEEVVRFGTAEPCERVATGYATHPECPEPYPACEHHRDRTPGRHTAALVDLLARRPELRDVGIAGYLAGAAVDGAGAAKTPETWLEVEAQPGGYIGYYLVYPRWRRWLIAREVAA